MGKINFTDLEFETPPNWQDQGMLTVTHQGKPEKFQIAGGFLQVVSNTVRVVAEAVQKTD